MAAEDEDRPVGYDLLLPPGWWLIPTDPVGARESIRRLLDTRLADLPRDTAFQLRTELEARLRELVGQAQQVGAIDVLMTVDPMQGLPVMASCLVTVVPGDRPVPLDEIRERMAEGADEHGTVEIAGAPALRVRRRRVPPPDRTDDLPATVVEHVVPVPGSADHMALIWSTPIEQLGDEFASLFDAVAGTLRWKWAGV